MYRLLSKFYSAFRSLFGLSGEESDKEQTDEVKRPEAAIVGEIATPGTMVKSGEATIPGEVTTPDDLIHISRVSESALPNWTTGQVNSSPFKKAGRIAMCPDGLEIHSDLDERGFILPNEDIDAVLDGEKRNVRLFNARTLAGSARLSASGRALNLAIPPFYYTIPLRSVLAVLDGRNRKGAVFVGK